jgi:hypothetical protein
MCSCTVSFDNDIRMYSYVNILQKKITFYRCLTELGELLFARGFKKKNIFTEISTERD